MVDIEKLNSLINSTRDIIADYEKKLNDLGGRIEVDPCHPCTSTSTNQYKLSWNLLMTEQTLKMYLEERDLFDKKCDGINYVSLISDQRDSKLVMAIEVLRDLNLDHDIKFTIENKIDNTYQTPQAYLYIEYNDGDKKISLKVSVDSYSIYRYFNITGTIGYRKIRNSDRDNPNGDYDSFKKYIMDTIEEVNDNYQNPKSNDYSLVQLKNGKYYITTAANLFNTYNFNDATKLFANVGVKLIKSWHRDTPYEHMFDSAFKNIPYDKIYISSGKLDSIVIEDSKDEKPHYCWSFLLSDTQTLWKKTKVDLEYYKQYNITVKDKTNDNPTTVDELPLIYVNATKFHECGSHGALAFDGGDIGYPEGLKKKQFVDYIENEYTHKLHIGNQYGNHLVEYNGSGEANLLFNIDKEMSSLEQIELCVGALTDVVVRRISMDHVKENTEYFYRNKDVGVNTTDNFLVQYSRKNVEGDSFQGGYKALEPSYNSLLFDDEMNTYRVICIEERYFKDKSNERLLICRDMENSIVEIDIEYYYNDCLRNIKIGDGNFKNFNDVKTELLDISDANKFWNMLNSIKSHGFNSDIVGLLKEELNCRSYIQRLDNIKQTGVHKCKCGGRLLPRYNTYTCSDKEIGCDIEFKKSYIGYKCKCGGNILALNKGVLICESYLENKCKIEHMNMDEMVKDNNWDITKEMK